MPDPNPTVCELFKAKAVTDEQVIAAVEASVSAALRSHGDAPSFDGRYRLDGFFDVAAVHAMQDQAR
ncbi:hypothetical protein MKK50_04750 [Methylobacterium sp. J-043]|nr:hypothetical protein [Methylobacterium sp. J-043]